MSGGKISQILFKAKAMQKARILSLTILALLPFMPAAVKGWLGVNHGGLAHVASHQQAAELRAELLMSLDLFVRAERVIRTESGEFTRGLERMPDLFGALAQEFRIEVVEADSERLLVVAAGEASVSLRNNTLRSSVIRSDRAAIDQDFSLRSNFPMPKPPREYLHVLARTVMNKIFLRHFQIPGTREIALWEGVFRGFFKYEVRSVSQGGRTLVAVGIQEPVLGDTVEMQPGADLFEWVYRHRLSARTEREVAAKLENLYMGARIYHEQVGSFASSLAGVVPAWPNVAGLDSDAAPYAIQEFQLDPTFGFHAEVGARHSDFSLREPASERAWAINGYGQVTEVSPVHRMVQGLEHAHRAVSGDVSNPAASSAHVEESGGAQKAKELVIDALEPEFDR